MISACQAYADDDMSYVVSLNSSTYLDKQEDTSASIKYAPVLLNPATGAADTFWGNKGSSSNGRFTAWNNTKKAPIIKKNEYDYIIHPIIDGIPEINPVLLEEVVDEILKRLKNIGEFDKILTIESMGIPLAANLSNKTNVPFTIIRKRKYGFSDELIAYQKTGYSKNKLVR